MSWRTVFLEFENREKEEKEKRIPLNDSLLSQFSHFLHFRKSNSDFVQAPEWQEMWGERSAIIEYEAGHDRRKAEELARGFVTHYFQSKYKH